MPILVLHPPPQSLLRGKLWKKLESGRMLWVGHILEQMTAVGWRAASQCPRALWSSARSFWMAHLGKKLSKCSAGLAESSALKVPPKCHLLITATPLLLFLLSSRVNCRVEGRWIGMRAGREESIIGRLVEDELLASRFFFGYGIKNQA